MGKMGEYRTFVRFDEYERWVLKVLGRAMQSKLGKNRPPPMSDVLRAVIREYWDLFEKDIGPERAKAITDLVPKPLSRKVRP